MLDNGEPPRVKVSPERILSLRSWEGKGPSQVRPGAQPFKQPGHCSAAGGRGGRGFEGAVAGGGAARPTQEQGLWAPGSILFIEQAVKWQGVQLAWKGTPRQD